MPLKITFDHSQPIVTQDADKFGKPCPRTTYRLNDVVEFSVLFRYDRARLRYVATGKTLAVCVSHGSGQGDSYCTVPEAARRKLEAAGVPFVVV